VEKRAESSLCLWFDKKVRGGNDNDAFIEVMMIPLPLIAKECMT
jgi:hypothetical protein